MPLPVIPSERASMELLGNKEIVDFLSMGKIGIKDFSAANLDLISYMPTFVPIEKTKRAAKLKPGGVLRLVSREKFTLNPEVVGMLQPTAETARNALLVLHGGVVHPLFAGQLEIAVSNVGSKPFEWTSDLRPARILFFDVPYSAKRFNKDEAGAKSRYDLIMKRAKGLEKEITATGATLGYD
jgi:deoxycytidine triphosphate deaminase